MAIIKNLIRATTPSNKSKNVPSEEIIKVVFSEGINNVDLESKITLKEVNGESLEYTILYQGMNKTLFITPKNKLPYNKKIEVVLKGGKEGISTIYDNTLLDNFSISFDTELEVESEAINTPKNVIVLEEKGFLNIKIEKDNAHKVSFKITDSNTGGTNLYPDANEEESSSLNIDISKKFEEGIYYLWIRNMYIKESTVEYSEYKIIQIDIDAPEEEIFPIDFNLKLLESYPSVNQIIKDYSKMAFKFSKDVNTLNLKDKIKINLALENSFMDQLFTDSDIDFNIEENNHDDVITLSILESPFRVGEKYKVVLDKTISSKEDNLLLGRNIEIPFIITPTIFYTTIKAVRIILGHFNGLFEDSEIMDLIADISNASYQKAKASPSFKPEEWENGNCPYYISEYVKFKTVYLLVLNNIMKSASGSGKNIKLGDLEVGERNMNSTELVDLLKFLKDELDTWEDIVEEEIKTIKFAGSKTTVRASKGEYKASYPTFIPRVPYKELGGK